MALTVWARTPDLRRRGPLVLISAKHVHRDVDVGTWALTVDGSTPLARAFTTGWGVQVFEDGIYQFSGPATSVAREDSEAGPQLEISGVTDDHVLEDRLVYPNPAQAAGGQSEGYYKVNRVAAETIIADLVNKNAGPGALAVRRTRGLALYTSAGRGGLSSVSARFSGLLDEVRTIAQTSGLVVEVRHETSDPVLALHVRERANRSRAVRFRAGHGITVMSATFVAPTANAILVAGGGQGAARLIREHAEVDKDWGGRRVEVFQDRRDTTDVDELAKAGAESLAGGRGTARAVFETADTVGLRYGTHYQVGDTVTLEAGEFQVIEPVRSVELSWDQFGRAWSKVSIGDVNAEDDEITPEMLKRVRSLERALQEMAARQ